MQRLLGLSFGLVLSACVVQVNSGDGSGGAGSGTGGATSTSSSAGGQGTGAQGGAGGQGTGTGGGSGCVPPAGVGTFEIGTGEKCFETLVDGQEVPLMQGPQGGYHVWLGVGCDDCVDMPILTYGVLDPATGMTLKDTYESQTVLDLSNDAWPQAAGLFTTMPGLSWDPVNYPPPAKGTHVILYAKLSDQSMTLLHEGQVEVVVGDIVVWDPCVNDPMNCPDGGAGGAGGGTFGAGGAGGAG